MEAGFLDRVVPAEELLSCARDTAIALSKLNMPAHIGTKLAARADALQALRATIEKELTVEALEATQHMMEQMWDGVDLRRGTPR